MNGYTSITGHPNRWIKNEDNLDKDLPDLIYVGGSQYWLKNKGLFHREYGPAIVRQIDTKIDRYSWYLDDVQYRFEDYCKKSNLSEEDIIFLKLKYGC